MCNIGSNHDYTGFRQIRSHESTADQRAGGHRACPEDDILEGECIARLGDSEYRLGPGDCFGFPAGTGLAHQLVNRGEATVSYLEIGDRTPNESVEYPHDDLAFAAAPDGTMTLVHKDGTPY